jgi:2,5-dihydroxypyridine 5,6-dioxygenase
MRERNRFSRGRNDHSQTADKLLKDIMKTQPNETIAITCDTESDSDFVDAVEDAATSLGARPLVLKVNAPPHVGRAAEPFLPLDSLVGAVQESDVWIELNGKWLLYSKVWEEAMKRKRTRYMCLVGMTVDMATRCIGEIDVKKILEFQRKIQKVTKASSKMHYTTPGGTDITFENDPSRPVLVEGDVSGPGEYMLLGQVDWAPLEESIEGTIAFDGSVNPPDELGLLRHSIKLSVKEGKVVGVQGGHEAETYEKWLKSFNDENMLKLAHVSYGCNPGAKLTGNVLEDERIWGVLEWGLGNQSDTFGSKNSIVAKSHSDGITLKPTLVADGTNLIKDGKFVHPDLLDTEKSMTSPRHL